MSVKLTKEGRQTIRDMLISKRFKIQIDAIEKRKTELGHKIYNHVFSAQDRKTMNSLPDGWLPTWDRVGVKFGGSEAYFKISEKLRFPFDIAGRYGTPVIGVISKDHELGRQYSELHSDDCSLIDLIEKTRQQINGVLFSATTAKQLMDAWPEIKSQIETVLGTPKNPKMAISQLALRVGPLNEILGLKKRS